MLRTTAREFGGDGDDLGGVLPDETVACGETASPGRDGTAASRDPTQLPVDEPLLERRRNDEVRGEQRPADDDEEAERSRTPYPTRQPHLSR